MPIFEYLCKVCNREFEQIVFGDPEVIECPRCCSSKTDKLISSFAVPALAETVAPNESGPCPCGAPRRGMCGDG